MQEGQDYLVAMACAANFAWVNRSTMTFLVRQAFAKQFGKSPDQLDMHIIYDVSHNIAKACSCQPGLSCTERGRSTAMASKCHGSQQLAAATSVLNKSTEELRQFVLLTCGTRRLHVHLA